MIVAEAGTWHAADGEQQRMELAYELIDTAAECRADYVKFQCFTQGELFCPLEGDEKRWPHWRRTFLAESQWQELKAYAEDSGIGFLLSAFQYETVDWCVRMKLDWYKVASRAVLTYPYDRVPGPLLISRNFHESKIVSPQFSLELPRLERPMWLHCISRYPAPLKEAMWPGDAYTGLSDHSGTPWPAIDALARGCPIVEVHFRPQGASPVYREMNPDGYVSVSPSELRLVCEARDAFAAMRQE